MLGFFSSFCLNKTFKAIAIQLQIFSATIPIPSFLTLRLKKSFKFRKFKNKRIDVLGMTAQGQLLVTSR